MRTPTHADKATPRISLRPAALLRWREPMARIHDSVLTTVGNTPIVRLARLCRNLSQEMLAKCEFMNPGGSVKDLSLIHI